MFLDSNVQEKVILLFELNLFVTGSTDRRRWTFASRNITERLDQLIDDLVYHDATVYIRHHNKG